METIENRVAEVMAISRTVEVLYEFDESDQTFEEMLRWLDYPESTIELLLDLRDDN